MDSVVKIIAVICHGRLMCAAPFPISKRCVFQAKDYILFNIFPLPNGHNDTFGAGINRFVMPKPAVCRVIYLP